MEVVSIEELSIGDIILINGWEDDHLNIVTVDEINLEDYSIVPLELGGLDYTPDNSNTIVRISRANEPVTIVSRTKQVSVWKI